MDYKLLKIAAINSVLVLVYVTLVSIVMRNAEKFFDNMEGFFNPIAFLMLFVLSAAVVGTLIFVRPVMIYLGGGKKEGLQLLTYTLGCLLILTVLILALVKLF